MKISRITKEKIRVTTLHVTHAKLSLKLHLGEVLAHRRPKFWCDVGCIIEVAHRIQLLADAQWRIPQWRPRSIVDSFTSYDKVPLKGIHDSRI